MIMSELVKDMSGNDSIEQVESARSRLKIMRKKINMSTKSINLINKYDFPHSILWENNIVQFNKHYYNPTHIMIMSWDNEERIGGIMEIADNYYYIWLWSSYYFYLIDGEDGLEEFLDEYCKEKESWHLRIIRKKFLDKWSHIIDLNKLLPYKRKLNGTNSRN